MFYWFFADGVSSKFRRISDMDYHRKISGKLLNELWGVGAQHALYRADGKWYHQLTSFPGALFDSQGYVIFATERDYQSNPLLQITNDLHVVDGISAMTEYVRILAKPLSNAEEPIHAESDHKKSPEAKDINTPPKRIHTKTYRILRDTVLARNVKSLHNHICQICGETVELKGNRHYSEAHHIRPLGEPHSGPDIAANVLCVCPNHHAQLDYGAIRLDIKKLQNVAKHQIGQEFVNYHNVNIFSPD